jgi:hypothetical protein
VVQINVNMCLSYGVQTVSLTARAGCIGASVRRGALASPSNRLCRRKCLRSIGDEFHDPDARTVDHRIMPIFHGQWRGAFFWRDDLELQHSVWVAKCIMKARKGACLAKRDINLPPLRVKRIVSTFIINYCPVPP